MIVVSRCLLGENCKYNGGNNYSKEVEAFLKDKQWIAVCPEVLGGLPTPRIPCEIKGKQVVNKQGEDKTKEFVCGANIAWQIIEKYPIELAILKSKSPSCGKDKVYNGNFDGTLIEGNGLFAKKCLENRIKVLTEKEIACIQNQ